MCNTRVTLVVYDWWIWILIIWIIWILIKIRNCSHEAVHNGTHQQLCFLIVR